jgi:16S rRNA (guanine(966)-N(2))-methyltransferase RsmD
MHVKTPVSSRAPARPPRPARPKTAQSHEIRIIGGQWKRTKLKVTDKPGLRPTPDRVRETLFNWLGQDLSGLRCMDVFAGTGALGFEAASRGALEVTLVEQDSALVDQLKGTQELLQANAVKVVRGEGVAALRHAAAGSQNVIFLDPPFDATLHANALSAAAKALAPAGFVFLEAPSLWTDAVLAPLGLQVHRHLKAGAVHAHLLRAAP